MRRVIQMMVLVIIAAVFSTRLPVNLVVVILAAMAMEAFQIGDLMVILFASLCLDQFNMLPPGFSVLPLLIMTGLVRVLKMQIYVRAVMSRLLWLSCAIAVFYISCGALLTVRTASSLYFWDAVLWGTAHAIAEGALAALLSPGLHRFLTMSLADLQSRSIVVD